MANEVYANGREIACKAGGGKSPAAVPDVCMTPPENPATPPGVPVPYPNTGFEGDTTDGTRSVLISGKEVMQKNKSYYSKSTGDEAGCAAKKGVVSSVNRGKCYFTSWSFDVVFEGYEVPRHVDLVTHNHASPTTNTPPWANVSKMRVDGNSCAPIVAKFHEYRDADCPSGSQSHHVVDNANFTMRGARKVALKDIQGGAGMGEQARNLFPPGTGTHPGEKYGEGDAPCICLRGGKSNPRTQHGKAHAHTEDAAKRLASEDGKWTYKNARDEGATSVQKALSLQDWETECVKLVLDAYYKRKLGCTEKTELVAPTGKESPATKFDDGRGNMCRAYELVDV